MVAYKILKGGIENKEYGAVRDNGNGTITSFLFDPANTDYQAYLAWLAEGNEPLPAEAPAAEAPAAEAQAADEA